MYELHQVGENTFFIESPAKIGLYRLNDQDVILIDSGNDKEAGRKVRKILDAHHWNLKAILNTHSNADHIGGNQYLQNQTGCPIYAPGMERDFTCHPLLEPTMLYGGFPYRQLRHKFLMAKPSHARELMQDVLPAGFEIIPLPGHFLDMVGFRTPDNVVFLADCLSSKETLDKYHIGFLFDVKSYLETLENVKKLQADLFIPSHAAPSTDIQALADYNIQMVKEIGDHIVEICAQPQSFEDILKKLFDDYQLQMNHEQYVLVGSTVRSYLSWLQEAGRLEPYFHENRMLWKTAGQ